MVENKRYTENLFMAKCDNYSLKKNKLNREQGTCQYKSDDQSKRYAYKLSSKQSRFPMGCKRQVSFESGDRNNLLFLKRDFKFYKYLTSLNEWAHHINLMFTGLLLAKSKTFPITVWKVGHNYIQPYPNIHNFCWQGR